jgi:hypothetical protein
MLESSWAVVFYIHLLDRLEADELAVLPFSYLRMVSPRRISILHWVG